MSSRLSIVRRPRRVPASGGDLQSPRLTTLIVKPSSVYGCSDKRTLVMGGTAIERSMLSMGSIAIYNVKPVVAKSTTVKKSFTLYAVHVQNAITGRSWVVHRRYSDFLLLRQLTIEHFEQFQAVFPKLEEVVSDLYFPRKHKIRSNSGHVVEHRCTAFLEYLVMLHRVLISQSYLEQTHISDIGVSILRGFLGSSIVKNPLHSSAYAFPKPIPQCKLTPSDRAVVNQCGTLKTVLEDDNEYEDCDDDEDEAELGDEEPVCADSADDAASLLSDTDSHSTASELEEYDECRLSPLQIKEKTRSRKLFTIKKSVALAKA
jgi:hypothetical protein